MLNRIIIDNFATIEHLSFDLGDSLNIITGETGAGKSVLVQAISTVLGSRADISMIRSGCEKATIQLAGELDGEEVIISRELLSSGKSSSKLNGELITLGKLREFCADWVDIHGQYDNQQILNQENHIIITDSYHRDAMSAELESLNILYRDYRDAKGKYNDLINEEKQAKQQKDYLEFEYSYIEKLELRDGEDAELADQIALMKNSEKIFTAVNSSYEALYESDNSLLSGLARCSNEINSVSNYSDTLKELSSQVNDIYYQLEEVSSSLRDISYSMTFDEEDLDAASERLSVLEDAKRKYGKSISEIIDYKEDLESKLSIIQNFDYEKAQAKARMDEAYEKLEAQAEIVSKLRHESAISLQAEVIAELKDLDFANSNFEVKIDRLDEIGELGYDNVEFLISTNPGEALMPITKIASGGEISRIMLALKHIIGDYDNVETMIFDEIDTGISGKTALVVGKKLREIAAHHQVICITHLPQIAAYGKDNYLISKEVSDNRSYTGITKLNAAGKEKMLATLFSGSISDNAIEAARELIERTR